MMQDQDGSVYRKSTYHLVDKNLDIFERIRFLISLHENKFVSLSMLNESELDALDYYLRSAAVNRYLLKVC
jgi:hypothetical protein